MNLLRADHDSRRDAAYRRAAPEAWNAHWDSMPNSVRALYGKFWFLGFPFLAVELRIEAWGQLCFDDAANRAIAYHMHNRGMRRGWKYVSWRCEMDAPPVGRGKLSGTAPANFDIYDYVPREYASK